MSLNRAHHQLQEFLLNSEDEAFQNMRLSPQGLALKCAGAKKLQSSCPGECKLEGPSRLSLEGFMLDEPGHVKCRIYFHETRED